MKWLLAFILSCQCLFGANWYASPNGSPAGTGAINSPWDLATAIADNSNLGNPNSVVHAGDTIWLRGGNYAAPSTGFVGSLFGATNNPVTVRQFPSERARIDTALAGANDGL